MKGVVWEGFCHRGLCATLAAEGGWWAGGESSGPTRESSAAPSVRTRSLPGACPVPDVDLTVHLK